MTTIEVITNHGGGVARYSGVTDLTMTNLGMWCTTPQPESVRRFYPWTSVLHIVDPPEPDDLDEDFDTDADLRAAIESIDTHGTYRYTGEHVPPDPTGWDDQRLIDRWEKSHADWAAARRAEQALWTEMVKRGLRYERP